MKPTRFSNNFCPAPLPQRLLQGDGEYDLIDFEEVQPGDIIRIRTLGHLPTVSDAIKVVTVSDSDRRNQLTYASKVNGKTCIYGFPIDVALQIFRAIPVLPTEPGSYILIEKTKNYFNPMSVGTLAQLFEGKHGRHNWTYLDQYGVQHDIDPKCIEKWTPAFITTTDPND